MDLHIIPGIKAKDVAEAHQKDLLIQSEFNCNCMTYWIDEARNSAFCLIEAPEAQSVRQLHNKAHGIAPSKIIPVNKSVVESFLGRIYDPHIPEIKDNDLKVFNDPAFRTLVLLKINDAAIFSKFTGKSQIDLQHKYWKIVPEKAAEFQGEVTEQNEGISSILSFSTSGNAVSCALAIKSEFSNEERRLLNLIIAINAGVPVAESRRFFGDTIDFGKHLFYLANPDRIKIAYIIKKTLDENFLEKNSSEISYLSLSEEKIIKNIFAILEENISNEHFSIDELSEAIAMSRSSLNRVARALMGITPNCLIKEFRLNKSLDLLKEKNHTMSQIAFMVGFSSPSYFSKCFKEHFGISPSLF